jgi:hypothetical protein
MMESRVGNMETKTSSLVLIMLLLVACAPQSAATPVPEPTSTNTPLPAARVEPTRTLEPTATAIALTGISLDACRHIVEAKISSTGILEILFESDERSAVSIISEFGFHDSGQQTSSALWSDDTQKAVPFSLPLDALDPKISADHRWIVFRRDVQPTQSEFWVIGLDGKTAKKLGFVRLDEELKARYPGALFSLDYGWIPNTDNFFYDVEVTYGSIPPLIIDKLVLVNVNSGKEIPLAIQSEIEVFRFSPDGSQMTILTDGELRAVSTENGSTQYTVQATLNDPTYSPDGRFIVDFIDECVLRIDARDGQQQIIPLKYTIMSTRTEGPAYGPLPDFVWADNSTLLITSLNFDKPYIFWPPVRHDPGWTFTIGQVDLISGTAHPIQTLNGDPSSAKISPDRKFLAFQKFQGVAPSQRMELLLVDLATGQILETIEDSVFEGWSPDSDEYIYSTGHPTNNGEIDNSKYYLGHIGKKPILMNWRVSGSFMWLDGNKLVMDCKICHIP